MPAREQQFKKVGTRVRVIFPNDLNSAEAAGVEKVLQRGKRAANDPLHCVNDPLYSLLLCFSTAAIPYCDTGSPLQSDRRSPAASPLGCYSLTLSRSEGAAVPS